MQADPDLVFVLLLAFAAGVFTGTLLVAIVAVRIYWADKVSGGRSGW